MFYIISILELNLIPVLKKPNCQWLIDTISANPTIDNNVINIWSMKYRFWTSGISPGLEQKQVFTVQIIYIFLKELFDQR